MKQFKNSNGTVTTYNMRNEEMARNLRKLGHKVVEDKKKQVRTLAERGGTNENS